MSESIAALVRISKEDRSIQTSRRNLDKIPEKRKIARANVDLGEAKLDKYEKKLKNLNLKIRERENLIKVESEKVGASQKRMELIKNQKEYFAIQKESEIAERTIRRVEDQILELEEKKEALSKGLSELQEWFDHEKNIYTEKADNFDAEESAIMGKIADYDRLKEELTPKIEPELYKIYQNLMKRNIVPAAIEIDRPSCPGCAMAIRAQVFNDIIRNQVGECPNCTRIVYYRAPEPEPEKEKPKRKPRKTKAKAVDN